MVDAIDQVRVAVELTGLHRSQFLPALQATPLAEPAAVHHRIRTLLDTESPDPDPSPRQPGRHRRLPTAVGHLVA